MGIQLLEPPLNIKKKDWPMFDHGGFGFSELRLLELKEIIVTFNGLCIDKHELLWESVHHHRDKMELYFLASLEAQRWKVIKSDPNAQFLVIHCPIMNIYHIITDVLPRLWMAKEMINEVTVILPQGNETTQRILSEALLPFNVSKVFHLPADSNVMVKNLLLPELKPLFSIFDPPVVKQIREFYLNWINVPAVKHVSDKPKKWIFLSHEDSLNNKTLNRNELDETIKKFGFESVDTLKLSFIDCLQKIYEAEYLISFDSHHLAYLQFMRSETSVLELKYNDGNEVDLYSNRYWHLSACLDIKYYYQMGKHVSNAFSNYLIKGIIFDLVTLEQNISKMVSK